MLRWVKRRRRSSAAYLTAERGPRRWRWPRPTALPWSVTPQQIARAAGLRFHTDPSPARWVERSLLRWRVETDNGLRYCVPEGFDAYARILHPASRDAGQGSGAATWGDVASWSGSELHRSSSFASIARRPDGSSWLDVGSGPDEGRLPPAETGRLLDLLIAHTATPEVCWFCLWTGYGGLDVRGLAPSTYVHAPAREYLLFEGRASSVLDVGIGDFSESPQLWWPRDCSWCVVTEIDATSTYVGGTKDCIRRLLEDPVLESFPAALDDRFDGGGAPGPGDA